jgi:glycosyltransferase involved in cell wall biosynthesis
VPSGETGALFESADVLVVPSHREPWGLVVNEALGHGLPVVAPYWVGAVADLVEDGVTGVVLRDNTPPSIARALVTLASRPRWARGLGAAGAALVRRSPFHLEGAVRAFATIHGELAG